MALIEIEITAPRFTDLARLIVTSAPIPLPTFTALGDRLVADITWDVVVVGASLPGFAVPPGMLLAQAPIKIRHVSLAELRANAGAQGTVSDATAWLLISLLPGRLRVDMVRLDVAGGPPQVFSPPLLINFSAFDLPDGVGITGTSMVLNDGIVTWRFGTAQSENLLLPPANRLKDQGDDWLIRVSGELLADQVLQRLREGLTPPPAGATIEDAPSAAWVYHPFLKDWVVLASAGLEKEDACPGLFGDVDISVTVGVVATFQPNVNTGNLGLRVAVSSNASDWDSFRCWAGGLGLLGLLGATINPFLGLGIGVGTLIGVGEIVRTSAGDEIQDADLGDDLTLVDSSTTSATYQGQLRLPMLSQNTRSATLSADGLIVTGLVFLPAATHTRTFQPNGGNLAGVWQGHFSCKENTWKSEFLVPSIMISDVAFTLGQRYATVLVRIFPTSIAEPPDRWRIEVLTTVEPVQYVEVKSLDVTGSDTGLAFVHTSAGIRRFDIPALPPEPPEPNDLDLALRRFNCRRFYEQWAPQMELHWLPDPPPFHYGYPPLRQWLVTLHRVPKGARLVLRAFKDGEQTGMRHVLAANRAGEAAIEVITDATTELRLEHNMDDERIGARLGQRWLLPTRMIYVRAPVRALTRSSGKVSVTTARRVVSFDPKTNLAVAASRARSLEADEESISQAPDPSIEGVSDEPVAMTEGEEAGYYPGDKSKRGGASPAPRPPFSISLTGRQVAAAWEQHLVIAFPWGTVTQSNLSPEPPDRGDDTSVWQP